MRRALACLLAALWLAPALASAKIPGDKIKIGLLQDLPAAQGGETGNGGIVAAQLAAATFERTAFKDEAEILPGATRDAPDRTLALVRDWLDKEHVAAIVSSAGPYLNAQVARLVAQRHRTLLVTGDPGSAGALLCQPDTVVWAAGLAARSRALVQALQPHGAGGWYVLADRSPMGVASGAALRQALHDAGGTLAGEADNVPGSTELDRLMPKVAAAGARVVALLETDGDLIRALRQASRAGLSHRSELAAPFARIADIDDSGVAVAAGLAVVAPFYWDRDDRTRDFARRWAGRVPGRHVTGNAATVYAATLAFLDAAKAADDVDADKVLAELRRAPIHDTLFGDVTVRQDGQAAYGLDVYRVRRPAAIRRPWQYYDRLATVPAAAAFPAAPCGGQPAG